MLEYIRLEELQIVSMMKENSGLYSFDFDIWGRGWGTTSFPGLQCEDEARYEEALVWAGQFCILIG